MRYLFSLIVAASLAVLLSAATFVYMIYWQNQQKLAKLVYAETTRLLDLQQQLNQALEEKTRHSKLPHWQPKKPTAPSRSSWPP